MSEDHPFTDPVDDCSWLPARELFRQLGFEPLPPSAVDQFQLRGRLWEFIYALAGRRFWLGQTDHLSDRALYHWLHDVWFNEEIPDIPPAAERNCRIDLTSEDTDAERLPETWLRFYATEADRTQWALDFPDAEIPPRETPPFDRDRWLPEPFGPPTASEDDEDALFFELEEDFNAEEERSEDDPLGLKAADAAIEANQRRERMRHEQEERETQKREDMAAITGGKSASWRRPIDELQRTESLLPPDELTDETLPAKLWELLHNLACHGYYVLNTNHLSDRELYVELWSRGLREEGLLPGKAKNGGWYHDCIGSGSEEDIALWMRYYSDEQERADWQSRFPNDPIPAKETPPFRRDWRLPKGPL